MNLMPGFGDHAGEILDWLREQVRTNPGETLAALGLERGGDIYRSCGFVPCWHLPCDTGTPGSPPPLGTVST